MSNKNCKSIYEDEGRTIFDSQICAESKFGGIVSVKFHGTKQITKKVFQDTCKGDR